ncbi:MAG: peptidoglycan DD-metalloendopeptidase family protein [Bacteroidales bacterium]|jgi:murein DD-endopeptidase MepM/ murein hydrolase activator NlpD|nr:peptidoglycan DD-metalloendopeptidase family protein [Bacteroidales bacterium]
MIHKTINLFNLFLLLLLLSFTISAQEDQNKNNQLIFSESDTLSFNEPLLDHEEDFDEFEDDTGSDQSMMFIYFNWMPGYGTYSNFDILKIHYVHDRTINPDTVILGNYVHPTKHKATSLYGVKRRRGRRHWGIDMPFPEGTPVVAAFDGIVRVSTYNNGGYGNLIVLRHENRLETYYAHLSRRLVNPGQLVRAGDTIGLGGTTGRSRGPHLHFETRYLGQHFNPTRIIDFVNYKLACDTLYIGGKVIKTNTDPVANNSVQDGQPVDPSPQYITVRRGDTLGGLAKKYRTTVDKLKKLNNMKSDFLREGQKLRVK